MAVIFKKKMLTNALKAFFREPFKKKLWKKNKK